MNSTCATTTNGLATDASLSLKTPPPSNRPGRAGVGGGDDEERLARVGLSRVVVTRASHCITRTLNRG